MQKVREVFYVCLSILALAGAFHFGAQNAQGQGTSPVAAAGRPITGPGNIIYDFSVILENGDVWGIDNRSFFGGGGANVFIGNIFAGSPVQATETTWGRIKADRR